MSFISNDGCYNWIITNGNLSCTIENLVSGTLIDGLYQDLSIGNAVARQLNLTMWGVTLDPTSPIVLSVKKIAADGTETTVAKGTYFIDTLNKSPYSEYLDVVAFDAMLKTEVAYEKTGGWVPKTDWVVVQEIATQIGVSIESATATYFAAHAINITDAPAVGINGVTDREMLSYIGVMHGGNWIINDANKLVFVPIIPATAITPVVVGDEVAEFDVSPTETVKRIELRKDSETVYRAPEGLTDDEWTALGGKCLTCVLPIMATQSRANGLLTTFNNLNYIPYTATEAYIDPDVALGTPLTIKDSTVILSNRTINIDLLSSSDLDAKSTEQLQSNYPYVDPVERQTTYLIGQAQDTAEAAQSSAQTAQDAADSANAMEQLIYYSAVPNTTIVDPPKNSQNQLVWVTDTTGGQGRWTTKRPPYNKTNPVLFVATERQAVDGTLTCTTPMIDDTTTVIDGGHILTHSIQADAIVAKSLTIGYLSEEVQTSIANGDSAFGTANQNERRLNELDGYIHADGDTLTLGKSDNAFKAQLNSQELDFYQGDDKVAYFSNSKLNITEAEIKTNLQVGNYQWIAWSEEGTNKGRMSLKWVASQS